MSPIPFVKGHGTENDFIVLPDPAGTLDLTPQRVRALCDRRRGIGADGVLRVVRAEQVPDAPGDVDGDDWFMDYRNADGSIAQMCGNGVRLFARYLTDTGLVDSDEFVVGSRAGARPVVVHEDGAVTVDMGPALVTGRSSATVDGAAFDGVCVDVGNPHLACVLTPGFHLDGLDLRVPPGHDPVVFAHGVNVEFVVPGEPLRMRVHERGVGETRSCGTGAVAAVAAALHVSGSRTGESDVVLPGGTVHVVIGESASTLTGPAVIVASGQLDEGWWEAVR